jgi:hypothetical protein
LHELLYRDINFDPHAPQSRIAKTGAAVWMHKMIVALFASNADKIG